MPEKRIPHIVDNVDKGVSLEDSYKLNRCHLDWTLSVENFCSTQQTKVNVERFSTVLLILNTRTAEGKAR